MPPSSTEPGELDGLRLVVVGTGPVGQAFALGLARAGAAVALVSREPRRARARAKALARSEPRRVARRITAGEAQDAADGVLLCVPDRELEAVAARVAGGEHPPAVALHPSGALGHEVLEPLAAAGASTGSLHPLVPFAPARRGGPLMVDALDGAWFAIEGEPRAARLAARLVRALGGRRLALRDVPGAKLDYHAAAALLSNGLVALFAAALHELEGAAVSPREARGALLALLESTVANLNASAPERALTGPVARGDAEVVLAHLASLDAGANKPGEGAHTAELYRELMRGALTLARAGKRAPQADLDAVAALLARPKPKKNN